MFQENFNNCVKRIILNILSSYELAHKSGDIDRKESSIGGIGMGGSMRMGSAKDKKPLEGANTKFFVGTEVCCE